MKLVYWGECSGGLFGQNSSVLSPMTWDAPTVIVDICGGEEHTLFLTKDGDVFSCGHNGQGQLGRQVKKGKKSGHVNGLSKVVAMACGKDHCLVVNTTGDVFSWGAEEDGQLGFLPNEECDRYCPSNVPMPLPVPVIKVACGNSHSLALTKGGDVYSWGLNSHGQLGLGKEVSLQYTPALIPSLVGVAVTQIAAGAKYTLFLTLPGLVYCCGANEAGQLGLNRVDERGRFNICMVPALTPLGVSFISCGEAHTAVLTKDGEVFTFGDGRHGQLGHNSSLNEVRPRLVDGLDGPASQVACGRHHTLVLSSSGQLWAFGNGAKGQIGTGRTENSLTPSLVQLPPTTGRAAAVPTDLKIVSVWNTNVVYRLPAQNSRQSQIIGRVEETTVQRWLAAPKSMVTKREMLSLFFTSSSLVAGFTKANGRPTEAGALTVDLEAASRAFDQLMAMPEIELAMNLQSHIGLLYNARQFLRSPEIFLILLTLPILQDDSHAMNDVLTLAISITELNEKPLKILKTWWSSVTPTILMKHISVFKRALSFMLRNGLLVTHNPGVKFLLEVLKLLYKVNKSGKSYKVPLSTFYVEEIVKNVVPLQDVALWCLHRKTEDDVNVPAIFCRYPFLLTPICKVGVFNIIAYFTKEIHHSIHLLAVVWPHESLMNIADSPPAPVFQLTLRRPHLVEDTFRQIMAADHIAFERELVVKFVDDRKETNVNKRDFFLHVFDELIAPESEMFMYNERKTLAWFPPKPKVEEQSYFVFGVLCGLALYNHNIVHLPFPLVLFKKLLRVKPSLDDMKEFEPVVARSLQCVMEEYAPVVIENLQMTYTVSWDGESAELDPRESERPVTNANKKEFVAAFIDYAFNTSVERTFDAFKRGFFKVCNMDVVDLFQPEELHEVMVGQETYDWDVFKQNTVYSGDYHAEHPNIVTFWKVFETLTPEQKKGFLLFLTGCDRVPFMGMESIKMTITVLPGATEHHFPESLTCHLLLYLPLYRRHPVEQTMRDKLLNAIDHNRGFWKE